MKYARIGGAIGALHGPVRMAATDCWSDRFRRLPGRGLKHDRKE
jgi:hypothetical protein